MKISQPTIAIALVSQCVPTRASLGDQRGNTSSFRYWILLLRIVACAAAVNFFPKKSRKRSALSLTKIKVPMVVMAVVLTVTGCASLTTNPKFAACTTNANLDYTYPDGNRFVGNYYCDNGFGTPSGKGTLYRPDGSVTTGNFYSDIRTGGVPVDRDGEYSTRFANGRIVRSYWRKSLPWLHELNGDLDVPPVSGPVRFYYIYKPDGTDLWEIDMNGKFYLIHPGPILAEKRKIDCAGTPDGFVMSLGTCKAGYPDGNVILYDASGLVRIDVVYTKGKPVGKMLFVRFLLDYDTESPDQKYQFPNIRNSPNAALPGTTSRRHDVVDLKEIYIAKGTPKIVTQNGKKFIEFEKLDSFTSHTQGSNEIFVGGSTKFLLPSGEGQCENVEYNDHSNTKRSSLSREACSYQPATSPFDRLAQRSDKMYLDRKADELARKRAEMKERKQEEERRDKEWQDEQRRTRERWAREAEENASPPQRTSTPFDGLDSINKVMRDGQRQRATQPGIGSGANVQRTTESQKERAGNGQTSSATDNVKADSFSGGDGKAAIKECAPYMSETVTFPDPSQTAKFHREAAESNAKWRELGIPFCKYSNERGPTAGSSK